VIRVMIDPDSARGTSVCLQNYVGQSATQGSLWDSARLFHLASQLSPLIYSERLPIRFGNSSRMPANTLTNDSQSFPETIYDNVDRPTEHR
jgi:hypothetical protein